MCSTHFGRFLCPHHMTKDDCWKYSYGTHFKLFHGLQFRKTRHLLLELPLFTGFNRTIFRFQTAGFNENETSDTQAIIQTVKYSKGNIALQSSAYDKHQGFSPPNQVASLEKLVNSELEKLQICLLKSPLGVPLSNLFTLPCIFVFMFLSSSASFHVCMCACVYRYPCPLTCLRRRGVYPHVFVEMPP